MVYYPLSLLLGVIDGMIIITNLSYHHRDHPHWESRCNNRPVLKVVYPPQLVFYL